MTQPLPMLPTSVVGSHGLPGWVWLAREAMEAGRLGATDVRELMEDATQAALLDQERAGIDVVERIGAPDGLGIVEEWKLARSLTTKRLKATIGRAHV